ncbi:hypothetical protein HPB49_022714 [Dermacentor silvarum]|uniref:Uncharacterized protein n=1 Tax=Dermacentor silvarum TaxID=543639 RepID=A0ACB8CTK3_DERSI|nr:hypothetical protein HPB49_022714 [Dermacentor silvarum]
MRKSLRPPRKIFVIDSESGFAEKQQRRTGRRGTKDGPSNVFQQLRPVLFSLRVLGLYSGKQEKHSESSAPWHDHVSSWTCIVLGIQCAHVVASLASCLQGQFWVSAFSFLKAVIALASSQALIRKEGPVCRLARRLGEIPPATTVSLKTTATVMAALVWTFVLMRTFVESAVLMAYTPQELSEHAASSWFGIDSQLPTEILLPLNIVDKALACVLVDGSLFFSMALYLSFTVALRHRYVAFNAVIGRHVLRGVPLDADELRRLIVAHTDLGSTVHDLNTDFSPSAFVWVCLFVLGVCVEVSHFLGHRSGGDFYELVIFAQNLCSVTLAFFLLTVVASRLTEAADASLVALHRCLGHSATSPLNRGSVGALQWSSPDSAEAGAVAPPHLEGRLLASMLRAPKVELTGWGFFVFSRSFVLTLAGALISYVVIILQLNPATSRGGGSDH